MSRFANKVVVITDGTSGIGHASYITGVEPAVDGGRTQL
jgi:hypothetical protein